MTYPPGMLVHKLRYIRHLQPPIPEWDAFGFPINEPTEEIEIPCRFGRATGNVIQTTAHRTSDFFAIVACTDLQKEDEEQTRIVPPDVIRGLIEPYTDEYRVTAVRPAMVAHTPSHYVLDLDVVDNGDPNI